MLVALAVGLVAGPRGVPIVPAAMGAVGAAAAAWLAARDARSGRAVLLMTAACLCAGAAWGAARTDATDVPQLRRAGEVRGTVVLDQPPAVSAHGVRAQVITRGLAGAAPPDGTRLLLDLPSGTPLPQVGYVVRVSGVVGPAAQAGAPDWWVAWLRRQRIAGRIRARGWQMVGTRGGPAGARDALRRWAGDNVAAGLTGDTAAIVRGMALGGGLGLSEDAAQQMRDAGLWHLLAVSGQNVAVVGIGMAALLGAFGMSRRSRLLGMGAAMAAYCLACDGGASVVRAGLMGGLALAADLGGAPRLRWHALLLALVVMLASDPLSVGDPGLQLSFAAVCGLFVIAPPLARWLRGWLPGPVADLVAQSGGAGLATAPVLASGFGSLSTVGLLANLVAVPVAGPVVVVALVATVGHWLWAPVGVALSWLAALGAWVVMAVARAASAIPGAVVPMPAWAAVPLAALAAAPPIVWWWLRRVPDASSARWRPPAPARVLRVGAVGAALSVLVAVVGTPACGGTDTPPGPALRVLDVGQGSAALLRDGARGEVLIDAGPPGDSPPVLDALARAGVSRIAVIVISHGAIDHSGGAIAVMDAMPVGRVVLPEPDRQSPAIRAVASAASGRGIVVTWASAGTQVTAGAWTARVIGPGPDDARSPEPNDRSLVVLAEAGAFGAILPGDAEGNVLRDLPLPRVPVLVVSHHGSEDPAIGPVLRRVHPVVGVISAGAGNQFGHPRAQVLQALGDVGADVQRTDEGGDVDLRASDQGIVVRRG